MDEWDDGDGHVRSHTSRKTRWIEPKTAAQIFILKNRDRKHWQDNPIPEGDAESLQKAKEILDGVDSAID